MRKVLGCLSVLCAMTCCCTASADSIFKFGATVDVPGNHFLSGFDVQTGDTISGTFGYGTPGESDGFIRVSIDGVRYSATPVNYNFFADYEEADFFGIGDVRQINAMMGIAMIKNGPRTIANLTGDTACLTSIQNCPVLHDLPTAFSFLDVFGPAQLQIRSTPYSGGQCFFGFPSDPCGGSTSPYFLNADINFITPVPEPPTFALLTVGLMSALLL